MRSTVLIFCCILLTSTQGRMIDTNLVNRLTVWNGTDAELGERPYQVSLQEYSSIEMTDRHFCGGVILNEYWILAAAHCVKGRSPSSIKVIAGTISLKEPYRSHHCETIIVHEYYAPVYYKWNDIALLKVSKPFEFSMRIQPAILPEAYANIETNSSVVVSGWGDMDDGSQPDILQKATIYIFDQLVCRDIAHSRNQHVFPSQICATYPPMNRGHCRGDSGGPLTKDGVLIGIVAWSIKELGCGSPLWPGVYTRVSEYIDWINENIK